ncbi:MAG: glycosyltransferase family 9 protein [Acidiferrobacter sp.]
MGRRASRLPLRARIAWHSLRQSRHRTPPEDVGRVLIAHNLLLGDTLMLTALIAGLRAHYPKARLVMTCPPALLPLYEGRPYGIETVAFDPRDRQSLARLIRLGPYDLAIVPAESRHGWLARAAGARWVRGFQGGPWYYRSSLDEGRALPDRLVTLADLMASLALHDAGRFDPSAWPPPARGAFEPPKTPYAVLHLGAGSPLKYWPAEHWRATAEELVRAGLGVVLSAGRGQESLAHAVDPQGQFLHVAGRLDLRDMWHLLAQATLLVAPDTGIVHLARVTGTPSVVLFGPGQAALYGPGRFFGGMSYRAVTVSEMPCRNEKVLFERVSPWVQTCVRAPSACHFHARCSTGIGVAAVMDAVWAVLKEVRG